MSCWPSGLQHVLQFFDCSSRVLAPGVALEGHSPRFGTQALTQRAVLYETSDAGSERVDISGSDEHRRSVVRQHLADLIEIRGDDALPRRHVLEELRRRPK